MGFLDTITGLFGIGRGGSTPPGSVPSPTPGPARNAPGTPNPNDPQWKQMGYDSEAQYNLDNGIDAAQSLNANGLNGDGTPIVYPSNNNPKPVVRANVAAPTDPNGTGGAGANTVDRSNSIAVNQAALAAAEQQRTGGLAAIQDALAKLMGRYSGEASANEENYTGSSNTNKNNLQTGTQAALINAAQGRKGLFGVLSSIGALSGSGISLANNAVQKGANDDISGANETFGDNQSALDTNIGQFRTADEQRRKDAEDAAIASRTDVENKVAGSKQKIYSNLADDYSQMGNAAEAKRYSDLVASLFGQIAETSVPTGGPAYAGAAYSAAPLAKYVGGGANTQVATTPSTGGGALPGLVAYNPLKRKVQD